MKVACEIAVMAADAGLIRSDEEIISVAGTHAGGGKGGADTAIVLQPAPAHIRRGALRCLERLRPCYLITKGTTIAITPIKTTARMKRLYLVL
ncbi:hypothetical protein ES703_93075 [subsurface metagenome]